MSKASACGMGGEASRRAAVIFASARNDLTGFGLILATMPAQHYCDEFPPVNKRGDM